MVPSIKEGRLVGTRHGAFFVVATSSPSVEFESLEACLDLSLLVFRRQVKMESFRQAFELKLILGF